MFDSLPESLHDISIVVGIDIFVGILVSFVTILFFQYLRPWLVTHKLAFVGVLGFGVIPLSAFAAIKFALVGFGLMKCWSVTILGWAVIWGSVVLYIVQDTLRKERRHRK